MIRHVILTNEDAAMVLCYKLAATLTLSQRRAGTLAYSAVQYHPTDTALFAVQVDDSDVDIMTVVNSFSYTLSDLDTSWYPDVAPEFIP